MPQNKISKEELDDVKRELQQYNIEDKTDIWFNSQEKKAYDHGYIEKHFQNYLSAKRRLRQAIIKAADDDNKKILLNAARIYSYTLFENTWYGYLIAYADSQESKFNFNGKNPVTFENAYLTHLPSFSSAILHFGTCRDLFFPLLKILIYIYNDGEISDLMKRFEKRIFYNVQDESNGNYKKQINKYEESMSSFIADNFNLCKKYSLSDRDFQECFRQGRLYFSNFLFLKRIEKEDMQEFKPLHKLYKLYVEIHNVDSYIFNNDMELLLLNSNFPKQEYLEEVEEIYKLNQFRNIFAHQLRMLWWKNRKLWGFDSKHYENIKLGNRDELWPVIEGIFKDNREYEKGIETLDESRFTSAAKVLQKTHGTIAKFLNNTFALIEQKPFYTESKQPDSTV